MYSYCILLIVLCFFFIVRAKILEFQLAVVFRLGVVARKELVFETCSGVVSRPLAAIRLDFQSAVLKPTSFGW